jgi:hypothetical protein
MSFDLNNTIELLVSDPSGSQPAFLYEREIRLYQFQTWIYCPDPSIVEMAAAVCGAKYLDLLERKLSPRLLSFVSNSDELKRILNDPNYRELYDSTIGEYGGWCKLVQELQRIDFSKEVMARYDVAETVCRMIDYRFRYLEHGGTDLKQANISHGEFFRWKNEPKLSWKTIRDRWSKSRPSAICLYVSKRFQLEISPHYNRMEYFFGGISRDAADRAHIRRFFGTCAYISEVLRGDDELREDEICIPKSIQRIRPETKPLSDSTLKKMSSYKAQRDEMRSS